MKIGDLVELGKDSQTFGLIIRKHPTKGVVEVYWSIEDVGWESCARLRIVSEITKSQHRPHLY